MKLKTASPEAVFLFYVTNITQKLKNYYNFLFFLLRNYTLRFCYIIKLWGQNIFGEIKDEKTF